MGNNISAVPPRSGGALDSYVSELGADIIYDKSLGSSRFLKTVRGRHRNGPVVVKLLIKYDPAPALDTYRKRLKAEREALSEIPNVYSYQSFIETSSAGYMFRQWISNNLYDRISTRPFLALVEKKWIAFQSITAMREVRARKIAHGDIKSENILVTSWNWIFITDFASFKPVYLPEDDPADYSFYFDTSGRRTCYLAPERFYTVGDNVPIPEGAVTEAMDVFSLGCVLAELFLDGRDTFTLAQLFKYRAGELNMDSHLALIEDETIRNLISRMIALDPAARPSFEDLLDMSRDIAFPESFYSFLHHYVISINETSSPSPFAKTNSTKASVNVLSGQPSEKWSTIPSDSDHRIERMWTDFDSVDPILASQNVEDTVTQLATRLPGTTSPGRAFQDVLPVQVHIPNRSTGMRDALTSGPHAAAEDGPALIVLSLVCANIRNCSLPSSKIKALDLLLALAPFLTDESKLDRLVPYVVELLRDEAAIVRASAVRALTQVVALVTVVTASNASFFPEYILPNVRYLTRDSDVMVRAMYAQCIVPLAEASIRFLEMSQAVKAHGAVKSKGQDLGTTFEEDSYDTRLADLQSEIEDQIVDLLVDVSSVVKRAVLHDTPALCIFFGRQKTNDVLLSHMITYLNDRDWLLRYAFFDSIVSVAACVGSRSLEEYILPLMIQALSDVEETVVAKVLASLTSLAELGLFHKLRIWELMSAATGFLYHPNIWIRHGAAAFIASSSKHLPATDVWCILYPSLRPLLRSDIQAISEQSLLLTVKPNLSRQTFDAAVAWAMKASDTLFWNPQPHRTKISKFDLVKEGAVIARKDKTSKSSAPRSEEDEAQITRLEQLGMVKSDLSKIVVLREYIIKLSQAIRSFASRPVQEISGVELTRNNTVGLQTLGIVPQTVFLNNKETVGTTPRRPDNYKRLSIDDKRHSLASSARNSDHGGAYGDLRRKLAQLDSSSANLNPPPSVDGHSTFGPLSPRPSELDFGGNLSPRPPAASPQPPSSTADTDMSHDPPVMPKRPVSPSAESLASNYTAGLHSALRTSKRGIHVGDGPKASPAIGTVNTVATATGVLETAHLLRAGLENEEPSGRSSPLTVPNITRRESKLRMQFPAPASTTYDGEETAIANVLEHVYQDNSRDGLHDFGPRVSQGPPRRRQPMRMNFPPREGRGIARRSEASLIANLTAHGASVNGIAVSPDHMFFVSCSDDRTVKVWDTARLERNVTSKPRHSYTQHHSRVTCVCMVEGSHCFVSAGEDGSIHVVRVHVTATSSLPKYGRLQTIREHRLDHTGEFVTSMQHYNTETSSILIYTTTHSSIVVMDLRSMRVLQNMSLPVHHGVISSACVDPGRAWLVTGTKSGVLSLWDLRFGLHMRSWKVGHAGASTSSSGSCIHQVVVHPNPTGKRTLVAVAVSRSPSQPSSAAREPPPTTLIEVWDIAKAALVEAFVTRDAMPDDGVDIAFSALTETENPIRTDTKTAAQAIAEFVKSRNSAFKSSRRSASPSVTASDTAVDSDARTIRGSPADDDTDGVFMDDPDREGFGGASRASRHIRAIYSGVNFGTTTSGGLRQYSGEVYGDVASQDPAKKGYLITGSSDRKITFWDLSGKIERSVVLSGLDAGSEQPAFKTIHNPTNVSLVHIETALSDLSGPRPSQRTSLITSHQHHLLKAHQDCITTLASLESPFRGGIVSGDRSGTIKVFRVDGE